MIICFSGIYFLFLRHSLWGVWVEIITAQAACTTPDMSLPLGIPENGTPENGTSYGNEIHNILYERMPVDKGM